jgi:hypothetical protein
MTPADMIASLDAALLTNGESVRVLRMKAPPATGIQLEADCMAVVRGYRPTEMIPGSGISQQDQFVILSPTGLAAVSWPGNGMPRNNDRFVTNRGPLTVIASAGIYVANVLVRIEAQVRGG